MRILLIEDEYKIVQSLKDGLESESFAVDVAYNGKDGLNAALNDDYDLVILDVMLPIIDGFAVCQELRRQSKNMPILMLTAKDQNSDIIEGLNIGADDYLAKPFSFEVLIARIQALLRRPHDRLSEVLQCADLELDTISKSVKRAGVPISLSLTEFSILEHLLRNKGNVLSKNNIMSHVWEFDDDVLPNNVEVFINYLRSKIDRPFKKPYLIQTVRGFGYKIGNEA